MGRSGLSQKLAQKWQWWDGSRKKGQRFEDLYVITTLVKMHFLVILFFKKYMSFFLKKGPKSANTTKLADLQKCQIFISDENLAFFAILPILRYLHFWDFCVICVIFGNEKNIEHWDFTSLGVRSNRILGRRMISISKNWFRTQICQIVRSMITFLDIID